MFNIDRRLIRNFDWITFSIILVISFIGIMTIFSATRQPGDAPQAAFYIKQVVWLLISICALIVIVSLDYIWLGRIALVLYITGVALLVFVLIRESPIELFSDEATPLFSRVLLPYYVAEELSKPLLNFRSADFFEQNRVTPHLGVRVEQISVNSKTVQTQNGDSYPFDKLLLATGGNPIVPPIPGIEKEGFPL